jgi:hypothetical protein
MMNNRWLPPFGLGYEPPGMFGGMRVIVKDAQEQRRTDRDVRGPWVRPKVPNKAKGREGTRRMWKRRNAPHYVYYYREPTDVLVLGGSTMIATPQQYDAIKRQTVARS